MEVIYTLNPRLVRIHARENNSIYGENDRKLNELNTRLLLSEDLGS